MFVHDCNTVPQHERTAEIARALYRGETCLIGHCPGRPQHRDHPYRHPGRAQHPRGVVTEPVYMVKTSPANSRAGRRHRHKNHQAGMRRPDAGRHHRAGKGQRQGPPGILPAFLLERQQKLAARTVVDGASKASWWWPPPPRCGHLSRSGEECRTIDRGCAGRADRRARTATAGAGTRQEKIQKDLECGTDVRVGHIWDGQPVAPAWRARVGPCGQPGCGRHEPSTPGGAKYYGQSISTRCLERRRVPCRRVLDTSAIPFRRSDTICPRPGHLPPSVDADGDLGRSLARRIRAT